MFFFYGTLRELLIFSVPLRKMSTQDDYQRDEKRSCSIGSVMNDENCVFVRF